MLFICVKVVDDEEFKENAANYRGYVVCRRLFVTLPKKIHSNRIAEVRNYYLNLNPTEIFINHLFYFI